MNKNILKLIIVSFIFLMLSCVNDENNPVNNTSKDIDLWIDFSKDVSGHVFTYTAVYGRGSSDIHLIFNGIDKTLFSNDTIKRTMLSFSKDDLYLSYIKNTAYFPMIGKIGIPSLVIAHVDSLIEHVLLEATEDVEFFHPIFISASQIAVLRSNDNLLELLLVSKSGKIQKTITLSTEARTLYSVQLYKIPDLTKNHLFVNWGDTSAIFDIENESFLVKSITGNVHTQPLYYNDSLYLNVRDDNYRYSTKAFDLVLLDDAKDLKMPKDSVFFIYRNDSITIYSYRELDSLIVEKVNINDSIISSFRTYRTEYFFPLFYNDILYGITETGNDNMQITKFKFDENSTSPIIQPITVSRENNYLYFLTVY